MWIRSQSQYARNGVQASCYMCWKLVKLFLEDVSSIGGKKRSFWIEMKSQSLWRRFTTRLLQKRYKHMGHPCTNSITKVIARRHKFDFLETKWRVQIWHTLIQRLRLWDEINGREPLPFSQPLPTAIFSMVQILQVQISMVQIWLHLEGSRCKVKKIIQRLCCCWEWA